ncbi:hypothetical protein RYX36_004293, partial [Vicia faba]
MVKVKDNFTKFNYTSWMQFGTFELLTHSYGVIGMQQAQKNLPQISTNHFDPTSKVAPYEPMLSSWFNDAVLFSTLTHMPLKIYTNGVTSKFNANKRNHTFGNYLVDKKLDETIKFINENKFRNGATIFTRSGVTAWKWQRVSRYEMDGYVHNATEEPKILLTGKWNESELS